MKFLLVFVLLATVCSAGAQETFTSKVPSLGKSSKCERGCLRCEKSYCYECEPGFQRTGYACAPIKEGCKDEKCQDCSEPVCYKCFDGYAITDETGLCKWTGPGGCEVSRCAYCPESKMACEKCEPGYQLKGKECRKKGCKEKKCMTCDPTGDTCLMCQEGYQLRKGACLELGCIDEFCLSCSPSGGTCYECQDGHRVTDKGQCQLCPENCRTCVPRNGGERCTLCSTGFYLKPPVAVRPQGPQQQQVAPVFVGGGCFKCEDKLDDCAECSADGTACHKCKEGFYLEEGNCIACPENCHSCKSPWFCDLPMEGFVLSGQGEVVKGDNAESFALPKQKLGWLVTISMGMAAVMTFTLT